MVRYMWPLFHHEAYNLKTYMHPFRDPKVLKLTQLSMPEIEKRLQTYTKFLFVRDPIVRFISGYRGKIASKKMDRLYFVQRAREISNETDESKPLSFNGFAKYAARMSAMGKRIPNLHFDGYFSFCGSCVINYTFIGTVFFFPFFALSFWYCKFSFRVELLVFGVHENPLLLREVHTLGRTTLIMFLTRRNSENS